MIDEKKLESEIGSLQEGWIALLETSAEKSMEVNTAAVKIMTGKGSIGIILSASRPYLNLLKIYKNNGIDAEKTVILDCVSMSHGIKPEKIDNVFFIDNIGDLTNIAISINSAIVSAKGSKFIFIDSITTMLIHIDPNTLARFIHSILTKIRINGISGLLVSLEDEANKEIKAEIMQLCDKVIRI